MKILRARVIEGSLSIPEALRSQTPGMTETNYELICPYNKENFRKLLDLGQKAYRNGSLSKMEILAWDGGAANHDGVRFLWSFRPDQYNFERIPSAVYNFLSNANVQTPIKLTGQAKDDYDSTWRQLQFGISLGVYESYLSKKPSLDDQVKTAGAKAPKANLEPVQTGPER